jgi:hypothetical protein
MQSVAPPTSDESQPETIGAPSAVRAQLLASEHWSLLATRSSAQSGVLNRITTFLMLVSSSIVSLALIGQFTRFDGRFIAFALVLIGALLVIGTVTQRRVGNAAIEDLAHVIGMNLWGKHFAVNSNHAAQESSWSKPPTRSRRTIWPPAGRGMGETGSGQRCSRPWWGRASW